jgi:4-amino-4-deoxy-L-arabinose transferase-like glycosyltransferase
MNSSELVLENLFRKLIARKLLSVGLIFLLAATLRVVVAFLLPSEIVWADGERYVAVAQNLIEQHGFGGIIDNRLSVPTQPVLIAAVALVFGKSYIALRLFFAVLGAATCVLGYLLAERLFDPVVALIAGTLMAIYPYYVYLFALFEYPQPFFIFIMAVAFLLLYGYLQSKRLGTLFLSGFCLGLGILSVPTAQVFVPLLLACLWVWLGSVARAARHGVILLLAIAIPMGSWAVRNYLAYGEFVFVNQAAGANFWVANNQTYFDFGKNAVIPACGPGNEGQKYCTDEVTLQQELRDAKLSDKEYVAADERAGWRFGWKFIRESPLKSVQLSMRKIAEFWSPMPDAVTRGEAYGGSARNWIAVVSYTPILLLAIAGALFSVRQTRRLLPIYGYILAFTAVYSVFLPTTRYRLPLDFFLILFAAYAIKQVCEYLKTRTQRAVRAQ